MDTFEWNFGRSMAKDSKNGNFHLKLKKNGGNSQNHKQNKSYRLRQQFDWHQQMKTLQSNHKNSHDMSKTDKPFISLNLLRFLRVPFDKRLCFFFEAFSIDHWSIAYGIHSDHILNQSIRFQLIGSLFFFFFLRTTFCVSFARGLLFLPPNIYYCSFTTVEKKLTLFLCWFLATFFNIFRTFPLSVHNLWFWSTKIIIIFIYRPKRFV